MVCRVRQSTPDRQLVPFEAADTYDSETEPDDSDLLTDPEDCIEVGRDRNTIFVNVLKN